MSAKVIAFRGKQRPAQARTGRQGRRPPRSDRIKYFTAEQIRLIRRTARDAADLAQGKGQVTAVRVWALIDLLTNTGLREAEAAGLRCGDLRIAYGEAAVYVVNGKGGRSRTVHIPKHLKTHLGQFLRWKISRGESTDEDAPLFMGQRGPLTKAGVADAVKVLLKECGLYERGKKCHALRHSYAVAFYRKEKDLRALQQQLGHSSVATTEIYASILDADIREQLDGGLY